MGINERRSKEKEALREKILKTVMELILKGGFEALTMRKIAEKIEYSPSTIYRFFKNKNELLGAITDTVYADLTTKFKNLKPENTKDSLAMLKMLITEYTRFSLDRPNIYRLYINMCRVEIRDNKMYENIGGNTYRIFSSWQQCLEDLIEKGKLKYHSAISMVILIWHTTDGFILNRINQPDLPWQSDAIEIDQLIAMIFNGILK